MHAASCMLKNRTILLVDDGPQIREVMRTALVSRGSSLIGVQGRDKALDVLRACTVDLVLLDMNVPVGLEMCRAIRGCWDVPIIIVSACDSNKDKVEALDGGADDFVAKPFSIDELIARMRAALRRSAFVTHQMPERDLVRLPCGHYQTPDEILRLAERISVSRRDTAAVAVKPVKGRPKKIATCRKCGESGGTLEMRSHKCC
jgi:DNA-binding response OmpR family regulator